MLFGYLVRFYWLLVRSYELAAVRSCWSTSSTSIMIVSAIASLLDAQSVPWNAALVPISAPPSIVSDAISVEQPCARSTTGYCLASSLIALFLAMISSVQWLSSFAFLSEIAIAFSSVDARIVHSAKRATPSGLAAPLQRTKPLRTAD